jgi:hypothetical protein
MKSQVFKTFVKYPFHSMGYVGVKNRLDLVQIEKECSGDFIGLLRRPRLCAVTNLGVHAWASPWGSILIGFC